MKLLRTSLRRAFFAVCLILLLAAAACDRQSRAGQEAEEAAERLGDELGNILNEAN